MKRITLLLAFVISLNILFAKEDVDRYLVKSGYVEYELTGNTTGVKKIWWDDYGNKEREEIKSVSEVKMFGIVQKEETHSITISVGDKFWAVDLLENTGVKGVNPYYDAGTFYKEDLTDEEKIQLENDILNAFGGERMQTEDFLGYPCEVMMVLGAKSWIYKGIVLKSTATVMGIVSNEAAIKFDENIKVPASIFDPPADIEYEDGSNE